MDILSYNAIQNIKSRPDWLNYLFSINDGSDGDYTPSHSGNIVSGVYRYNTVVIGSGTTIKPSGNYLVIIAKTSITINGSLSASLRGANGSTTHVNPGSNGNGICGSGGGGGGWAYGSSSTNGTGSAGGTTTISGGATIGGGVGGWAQGSSGSNVVAGNGSAGGAIGKLLIMHSSLSDILSYKGSGGGAGQAINTQPYGDGGYGGGILIVISPIINGTGTISSDGGNGYNGEVIGGANCSGGGGGGGGGCLLISSKNISIPSSNITANGGNGGSGAVSSYNGFTYTSGTGGVGGAGAILQFAY